jgi:hypothetical protein
MNKIQHHLQQHLQDLSTERLVHLYKTGANEQRAPVEN